MPFLWWNDSYYLILILQGICILHALKTGRRDYIYILLFLPLIGGAIYIIREVLPEINRGDFWNNLQRIFFFPERGCGTWNAGYAFQIPLPIK